MSQKTIIGIGSLLILIALGTYSYTHYTPPASTTVSNADDSAIRAVVEDYSKTLGEGRLDIVSVTPRASGRAFESYQVEANMIVMDVSQANGEVPVGVQPLSLTVEKQGSAWVVTAFTKGAYSELPHSQTIVGFWECLPHKNTSGPQTTECAFGIARDQSDGHYAIDTSLMSTYPVDFATGTKVQVTGIVTPANQLSSVQKYDIDGVIRATSIVKI
ncbi:MAG: hypothetical protein NT019_02975 [Candidatus Adlerbacteria bacterium]|nr:hypothetical protein [Candidatus Adlerbacteria bacterium]